MKREPGKKRRGWVVAALIVLIVALGANAYVIRTGQLVDQKADTTSAVKSADQAASEGKAFPDDVLAVCGAGGRAAKALIDADLCGKASATKKNIDEIVKDTPAAPSSTNTTTTIVRRETIPMSTLTAVVRSSVDSALLESCGADGCRDGVDGVSPPPILPSPGKDGQAGGAGPKGDTGAKGDKGDPPSDETLLELIRRVLSENPPADGADGRGITSLVCSSSLGPITFTLTLTDGTTQDFSCGTDPLGPEPAE